MPKLSVNVDHVATVRQARGGKNPDPVAAAIMAELAGADGIIVHLREDRRHIQDRDLEVLRRVVKTRLNLEMANTEEIVQIALRVKPDMVTLVPERRQELGKPLHRCRPRPGEGQQGIRRGPGGNSYRKV
ncbi:MAG: pyridoxine 5-phosphate synthase [Deltaproteobacteria bacterium]|nr:pyridoxine 5-phosphate synthase [Deltaproteobacteria bacterium]